MAALPGHATAVLLPMMEFSALAGAPPWQNTQQTESTTFARLYEPESRPHAHHDSADSCNALLARVGFREKTRGYLASVDFMVPGVLLTSVTVSLLCGGSLPWPATPSLIGSQAENQGFSSQVDFGEDRYLLDSGDHNGLWFS
jgi:hypothetical protein